MSNSSCPSEDPLPPFLKGYCPYDLLGVGRHATGRCITKAFRRKAKNTHPDKRPDDLDAHDKFDRLQKAFDFLNNHKLRADYDIFIKHKTQRQARFEAEDEEKRLLRERLAAREAEFAAAAGAVFSSSSAPHSSSSSSSGPSTTSVLRRMREQNEDLLRKRQRMLHEKRSLFNAARVAPVTPCVARSTNEVDVDRQLEVCLSSSAAECVREAAAANLGRASRTAGNPNESAADAPEKRTEPTGEDSAQTYLDTEMFSSPVGLPEGLSVQGLTEAYVRERLFKTFNVRHVRRSDAASSSSSEAPQSGGPSLAVTVTFTTREEAVAAALHLTQQRQKNKLPIRAKLKTVQAASEPSRTHAHSATSSAAAAPAAKSASEQRVEQPTAGTNVEDLEAHIFASMKKVAQARRQGVTGQDK
eukprot:GHVT01045793.1.p1 GENE.GHVT01045793.1~~GHVT01045793.1.p1  ORF type:complete len:415 (-),score=96.76 GHVT01045793.1:1286-2530(-)